MPQPTVKVYVTATCGFCRMAESLLASKGVSYERIDVTGDRDTRAWLVSATGGRTTVPQVFIDGKSIGGFQELSFLEDSEELDELLRGG